MILVFGSGYPDPNTIIIHCINICAFEKENAPVAMEFINASDLEIMLCGDWQYYIVKAIKNKSDRFPGNPPSKLPDTICSHCQLLDPCLKIKDDYYLCDACMYEQVNHDTLEYN